MAGDTLTDKERIRELELTVVALCEKIEKLEKKYRNLTARLERLEKSLRHFLWFFKSWKHFGVLVFIIALSYSIVDVFVDTAKVQHWFFKEFLPWAHIRRID